MQGFIMIVAIIVLGGMGWYSFNLMKKYYSLSLMRFFVETVTKEPMLFASFKFVEAVELENCEKIHRGEQFSTAANHKEFIEIIAKNFQIELQEINGRITVPVEISLFLRERVAIFLNSLEVVAAAYSSGLADKKIIKNEFKAVFKPMGHNKILTNYRTNLGIYPSIVAIEDDLIDEG